MMKKMLGFMLLIILLATTACSGTKSSASGTPHIMVRENFTTSTVEFYGKVIAIANLDDAKNGNPSWFTISVPNSNPSVLSFFVSEELLKNHTSVRRTGTGGRALDIDLGSSVKVIAHLYEPSDSQPSGLTSAVGLADEIDVIDQGN